MILDSETVIYCRLSQLDIQFMKRIYPKVNLIPIIAKADSLTQSELTQLKKKVNLDRKYFKAFKVYFYFLGFERV